MLHRLIGVDRESPVLKGFTVQNRTRIPGEQNTQCLEKTGDPDRIRTCNPRSRNPLLYPVELRDRWSLSYHPSGEKTAPVFGKVSNQSKAGCDKPAREYRGSGAMGASRPKVLISPGQWSRAKSRFYRVAAVARNFLSRYRYDHESVTIRALSMFQGGRFDRRRRRVVIRKAASFSRHTLYADLRMKTTRDLYFPVSFRTRSSVRGTLQPSRTSGSGHWEFSS